MVYVLHSKSAAAELKSDADLPLLQQTVAYMIYYAWTSDCTDVSIVGADKLPSDLFPIPRTAWADRTWGYWGSGTLLAHLEKAGVDVDMLLLARSLEEVQSARGRGRARKNFKLATQEQMIREVGKANWLVQTQENCYMSDLI